MEGLITLSKSKYFGENVHFHNGTSIKEFYRNQNISLGIRAHVLFTYFYNLEENANKAPQDRIVIQNPELLRHLGYEIPKHSLSMEYNKYVSAVQSMLERYELDGFWYREFRNTKGEWVPLYTTDENGQRVYNYEAHGLTDRRIVLNTDKAKTLYSTLPSQAIELDIKNRSREKRMLTTRPVTLVDFMLKKLVKITSKDKVQAIKEKKKIVNTYLEKQSSKYGDFNPSKVEASPELIKEKELQSVMLSVI